jgi:hypothetical protein
MSTYTSKRPDAVQYAGCVNHEQQIGTESVRHAKSTMQKRRVLTLLFTGTAAKGKVNYFTLLGPPNLHGDRRER